MRKQPRRLQVKKETLGTLTGASPSLGAIDIVKNTAEDCTSPLCMETTCPRTCGCNVAAEPIAGDHLGRH